MKGPIVIAWQEMIKTKYGEDEWLKILKVSNLPEDTFFYAHHDVEDSAVMNVIQNSCKVLNLSLEKLADAYGVFWMKYASKNYFAFFARTRTAKDFLMQMDRVHTQMTQRMANATPPKFTYEEISPSKITMTYSSPRNLEVLWIGLIKGVGEYFNERIEIKKLGQSKVELTFYKK